jgi:hypothetical protein
MRAALTELKADLARIEKELRIGAPAKPTK